MLCTRLQLADPGAAIAVYLFASAIAVQTTIQPLPPQIIDNKTTLPTPPGHVCCRCSPINHPYVIGSNGQNDVGEEVEEDNTRGEEEVEEA